MNLCLEFGVGGGEWGGGGANTIHLLASIKGRLHRIHIHCGTLITRTDTCKHAQRVGGGRERGGRERRREGGEREEGGRERERERERGRERGREGGRKEGGKEREGEGGRAGERGEGRRGREREGGASEGGRNGGRKRESASGAVNTLCFVWKFSCIKFHSLIHACMYIHYACNFIFTHQ